MSSEISDGMTISKAHESEEVIHRFGLILPLLRLYVSLSLSYWSQLINYADIADIRNFGGLGLG